MLTTHATWERENLGTEAYELFLNADDSIEEFENEEKRLIELGAKYIVVKTPVNVQHLIFGLANLGYVFVEMVFHVMIKRNEYSMPNLIARFDRGFTVHEINSVEDNARVESKIRNGIFVNDRISIDPEFTLELSSNRYVNWLRSMRENGATLYEVRLKEKEIGFFVIMRKDDKTVDPVLMGLYDEGNDRGMGAILHKKTLDTCFEHECAQLTSTIVSNNAKVLRVYVNAGATITDTLYTYVKHIK